MSLMDDQWPTVRFADRRPETGEKKLGRNSNWESKRKNRKHQPAAREGDPRPWRPKISRTGERERGVPVRR